MKLRILVIDDEVTSSNDSMDREPAYRSLSNSLGPDAVTFARSPQEAQEVLRREAYDVVMLDVWLRNAPFTDDDNGTVFQGLFTAASKVSMVALVSSSWDNTVVPRVNRLLVENPEISVPLMLSFDELRNSRYAAVIMQLQAEIRRRRRGLALELGANDPLHIAHISDLHFGSRFASETLAGEANLDAFASALMRTTDGPPHILAITGDVSNTGHPDEYEEAYNWLKSLCHELELSLPSRRVLLVPGNHDFSLPLALSMTLQGTVHSGGHLVFASGDVTKSSRKLARYATQGFHDFAALVTGTPGSPLGRFDRCWVEEAFREYGVVFSGLNTSGRVRDDAWPDRWLDHDDAIRIAKQMRALTARSLFHVMLSHHPPIQTPTGREPITNVHEFVSHFFENDDSRPNVILHGHEHARRGELPWGEKTLVICAPTPSVREKGRPPDSLRGLNLVTLNRRAGWVESAHARSLIHEGGRWRVVELEPYALVKRQRAKRPTRPRSNNSCRQRPQADGVAGSVNRSKGK